MSIACPQNVIIEGLHQSIASDEAMAQFDKPLDEADLGLLQRRGFSNARVRAVGCMGWIWRSWLQGTPGEVISKRVELFVDRGMDMREKSRQHHMRALHDLYLLHCAIFSSQDEQLLTLAKRISDDVTNQHYAPQQRFGEQYAAAWCGMLTNSILGRKDEAAREAGKIWGAYHPAFFRAASKTLVVPWLGSNWRSFRTAQRGDFQKLWSRARKDGWTIRAESPQETVVTTSRYPIEQLWCWAHCGLAVLAHRQGVEILTDPLWLPAHVKTCI